MSNIECMILGLINQGYKYGHELDKVIEERQLRLWTKITRVSIYQALDRMKKKGWVESHTEKEGKMPERNIYSLTDVGEKALRDMIMQGLATSEYMEFNISIAVSFLSAIPTNEAVSQLEKRKVVVSQALKEFPPVNEEDNTHLPRKANLKLLRGYYEMELKWLEWLISELELKKILDEESVKND